MKVGGGLLLNWLDIAPGAEVAFQKWHTHEHVPERVGLPGFLSGARFIAAPDHPTEAGHGLLITYVARSPAAFASAAYRARLDDPTPLTRQLLPELRRVTRGIYRVEAIAGAGQGSDLATLRFSAPHQSHAELVARLDTLVRGGGMVSAVLGRPDPRGGRMKNATQEGRSTDSLPPDDSWCLVLQASHAAVLEEAVGQVLPRLGTVRLHHFRRVFTLARADLVAPSVSFAANLHPLA